MAVHRHEQVVGVQHLVVLEVVQQGIGHSAWLTGKENGGAFNSGRWADKNSIKKTFEVYRVRLQFFVQYLATLFPGHHQREDGPCNQDRKPAALDKFERVRCQKCKINHKENTRGRQAQRQRVFPAIPDDIKRQDGGDQHVAAHRNAIGSGQRFG